MKGKAAEKTPRKMLDRDEVLALVPVSTATLYRLEKAKRFPQGRWVGNQKFWFADDIVRWQASRSDARRRSHDRIGDQ